MPDYATDMRRSCQYMRELKRIVGEHLIGEAPAEEDMHHNTDLVVLRLAAVRIACRVRRREYFDRYSEEFTIRSGRPNGAKTELAKILEGWGDYFLYGFADESDTAVLAWTLCDLKVFRLWFHQQMFKNRGHVPGLAKDNKDDSSTFRVFEWRNLPPEFIIASHRPPPQPVVHGAHPARGPVAIDQEAIEKFRDVHG